MRDERLGLQDSGQCPLEYVARREHIANFMQLQNVVEIAVGLKSQGGERLKAARPARTRSR